MSGAVVRTKALADQSHSRFRATALQCLVGCAFSDTMDTMDTMDTINAMDTMDTIGPRGWHSGAIGLCEGCLSTDVLFVNGNDACVPWKCGKAGTCYL
jgi:hypothetical protein